MAETSQGAFRTIDGCAVPALTAAQMREVDRVATEEVGLGILQMMENAGRSLAENVIEMLGAEREPVAILAGSGGNGGGGLCCARHLHNHGFPVSVVLSKDASELTGAAARQLRILRAAGVGLIEEGRALEAIEGCTVVVDALIGYSLRGAPRGRVAELIRLCNEEAKQILSLDVPSGLDATSGERPGVAVQPERTLTLALPKTGLHGLSGKLYLADIGIPPTVYQRLGLSFEWPDLDRYWVRIESR